MRDAPWEGAPALREPAVGLEDPLLTVKVTHQLIAAGAQLGLTFNQGNDFSVLARIRREVRGSDLSPMFDPAADPELPRIGFWLTATEKSGKVVAIQAFRLDEVTPCLAHWALGWMMALYARRQELIVPRQTVPPDHSLTALIRGRLAYQGEFWIDKHCRGLFDIFPRFGILLALLKWHPEAIWALTGSAMATRGHMVRAGFSHIEPSFLTWQWLPEGAEPDEWIAIASRRHIEFLIDEMAASATNAPVYSG